MESREKTPSFMEHCLISSACARCLGVGHRAPRRAHRQKQGLLVALQDPKFGVQKAYTYTHNLLYHTAPVFFFFLLPTIQVTVCLHLDTQPCNPHSCLASGEIPVAARKPVPPVSLTFPHLVTLRNPQKQNGSSYNSGRKEKQAMSSNVNAH